MEMGKNILQNNLKKYFGYDTFRQGQIEIIQALLQKNDVLAILPTGAGKSLCFQLAGLMMPGVTLVVTPLISLMKDQVEKLLQHGVLSAYIDGEMTEIHRKFILNKVTEGRCKFLYVSPERLANLEFREFAQKVSINFLVVDEAHCVSQWGKSFRKEYYEIVDFVAVLRQRPVIGAFTATATPQVRNDILMHLQIISAKVFVNGFDRPNLCFAVQRSGNKDFDLLHFLAKHRDEKGIVYCSTHKQVTDVNGLLVKHGYNSKRYHGGLTSLEREKNQTSFLENKCNIIVATNAFGMGIDKPDVRFVVHYNMPQDLESYYQEAGRAGRDGLPSECLLLYNQNDIKINEFLINSGTEDKAVKKNAKILLNKMQEYCETKTDLRKFILNYFGESV